MYKNKTLLITGGTGSFGNAALKKMLQSDLSEIRIFSRDEKKQDDMRLQYNSNKIKYYIGDVRDKNSLSHAIQGVDFVFHAAALKQVPSCEFFPMEAVRTNVIGCENVLDVALQFHVQKVIVLSTDKAVYPINSMGLTKALSEKVMIAKSRSMHGSDTIFCGTRYGNVMASRGSVIPLLVDQLKQGKELTLTDPEMTRFMMTLDEALDLVLYAFENGQNGDIFVQKAPACTIGVLAQALKELFQLNNRIQIIGTRHGEKLFETLVNREEMTKVKDLENYYKIPADNRDLNYAEYFSKGKAAVSKTVEYTSHNTERLDVNATKELLLKLDFIEEEISSTKSN